jgi:hypothetical protein
MSNGYGRIIGARVNSMRRSFGAFVGIRGASCNGSILISSREILFRWHKY